MAVRFAHAVDSSSEPAAPAIPRPEPTMRTLADRPPSMCPWTKEPSTRQGKGKCPAQGRAPSGYGSHIVGKRQGEGPAGVPPPGPALSVGVDALRGSRWCAFVDELRRGEPALVG